MVTGISLMTRRYEIQSLYYAIILILSSKQQSAQYLRFDFSCLILTLFIITALYDNVVASLLCGNGSAVDGLQTTPQS
jgi:hydrogenase-4 membrane subunit HyfE